jgi:DNA-binding transcriptional LysR family regulator
MTVDLVQLEIFKAVAEHGSISAAAQQIHRVPSNLTTRIKQLEQDLGVELFIREKAACACRRPAGIFSNTPGAFSTWCRKRAPRWPGRTAGRLPLGSLESTAAVRIPACWRHNQHIPRSIWTCPPAVGTMIEGVLSGRLAAAFVDGPVLHPALEGVPAFEEEMVIIAPLITRRSSARRT